MRSNTKSSGKFSIIFSIFMFIIAFVIVALTLNTLRKAENHLDVSENGSGKANNSPSWDSALLYMATGGTERRVSWDWDNRYIFKVGIVPFNLSKMKLYMCYSSQCTAESREKYTPTEGDKTAGDWVPAPY